MSIRTVPTSGLTKRQQEVLGPARAGDGGEADRHRHRRQPQRRVPAHRAPTEAGGGRRERTRRAASRRAGSRPGRSPWRRARHRARARCRDCASSPIPAPRPTSPSTRTRSRARSPPATRSGSPTSSAGWMRSARPGCPPIWSSRRFAGSRWSPGIDSDAE